MHKVIYITRDRLKCADFSPTYDAPPFIKRLCMPRTVTCERPEDMDEVRTETRTYELIGHEQGVPVYQEV